MPFSNRPDICPHLSSFVYRFNGPLASAAGPYILQISQNKFICGTAGIWWSYVPAGAFWLPYIVAAWRPLSLCPL